jgi:hypothetical protein
MSNTVTNLDRLAAQRAQAVIEATKHKKSSDVENTVTKALGVLQEDGLYACFLYLLAKEKPSNDDKKKKQKSTGEVLVEEMLRLLKKLCFKQNNPVKDDGTVDLNPDTVLKFITDYVTTDYVTQDLERLLLAKETLEQMLIYARYGAKARQDTNSGNGQSDSQENNS